MAPSEMPSAGAGATLGGAGMKAIAGLVVVAAASSAVVATGTVETSPVVTMSRTAPEARQIPSAAARIREAPRAPGAPSDTETEGAPRETSPAPRKPPPRREPIARITTPPRSLADELALLGAARSALGRGDASSALAAFEAHARRHPAGSLSEERDALRVHALCVAGTREAARLAAEAFVARAPGSPLAPAVLRACAERP